jgi:hypothetical protein
MMGDAVNESVRTLLMICGFIMLFSVLIKVLAEAGIVGIIVRALGPILNALHISPALVTALLSGVFEIDVGTAAASAANAPFLQKAVLASAIIAWSGLSVHAQVMSVISGTDIRIGPYMTARLLHALFSAGITLVLLGPAAPIMSFLARPVFGYVATIPTSFLASAGLALGRGLRLFLLSQALMLVAGAISAVVKRLRR